MRLRGVLRARRTPAAPPEPPRLAPLRPSLVLPRDLTTEELLDRAEAIIAEFRELAPIVEERAEDIRRQLAGEPPRPPCSCKGVIGDVGPCDGACAVIPGWEDRARFRPAAKS